VDDGLALAMLVGARVPIAQVVATEGSRPLEQTALTTARLLVSLGCAAPVRLGAASGLGGPYSDERDPFHGEDCFAGLSHRLHPATPPNERWTALEGPVLATGALTVVATAVAAGQKVGEVTWMGGSVSTGGNMTAAAEFNAWMDPVAADALLGGGHLTRMIPLDVTTRCPWTDRDVQALKACSAAGALVGAAAEVLCARDGRFVPHDAVATAAMLDPTLFHWVPRRVRCETAGILTTGETVVDRRRPAEEPHTLVAEDVDRDGVKQLVLNAVAGAGS